MVIYLEYEGIKGNVTADGYKDHISVLSVDFNVARKISMTPGNLSNRETSRPSISEVTIIKVADNSCSALFERVSYRLCWQEGKNKVCTYRH